LVQLVEEEGMSMTPYSPLAAGRVCRMWDDNTKRCEKDKYAKKNMTAKKKMICP